MSTSMADAAPLDTPEPEPRWHAVIAVLATVALYVALPPGLTVGPRWVQPALTVLLLIPTMLLHRVGKHRLDRAFGYLMNSVITIQVVAALGLLIHALPSRRETPTALLVSACAIWVTNLLVFALWYWRLDAGGPHGRALAPRHTEGAFLFPQMTSPVPAGEGPDDAWSPNFIDYLFLAFNTSTAFSPTDTPVLARWAKLLMMLQSIISLAVLVVLAGRAVNIL